MIWYDTNNNYNNNSYDNVIMTMANTNNNQNIRHIHIPNLGILGTNSQEVTRSFILRSYFDSFIAEH